MPFLILLETQIVLTLGSPVKWLMLSQKPQQIMEYPMEGSSELQLRIT